MSKVIVIGAGHGGLAAAARLRIKGHEVSVYESSANPVTIPQVLTLPAAYRDLFLKTGNSLEENIDLPEIDFALELQLQTGATIKLPSSGLGRTLTEIENAIGSKAADQWRAYINDVGQLWLNIRAQLVESKQEHSTLSILGFKKLFHFYSYSKLVKKHLKNSDLKNLANYYRAQAFVDPDSSIGLLALNSYVQQTFGIYQPAGGLSGLTNELHNRCLQLGVQFNFNTLATPVAFEDLVTGVELESGGHLAADFVVVNNLTAIPPLVTWRKLPSYLTGIEGLFEITERSWLGLGPAHAVLGAEIVAGLIGSAE